MADERIVDVGAMLSKWHDLLGSAYPNLPCQTFPMFIRNNSQELVRCRECKHRGFDSCPMCHDEYTYDEDDGGDYYTMDNTTDDGFCHKGERWPEVLPDA